MIDWQQVVAAHQQAVRGMVYRLESNPDDAADCFQETFPAANLPAARQDVSNGSAWPTKPARIETAMWLLDAFMNQRATAVRLVRVAAPRLLTAESRVLVSRKLEFPQQEPAKAGKANRWN